MHELNANSTPIEREFYGFYRTPRGEFTPASSSSQLTTHPSLSSNVSSMNFYPFERIAEISPRPLLFITGDTAHSGDFSEESGKSIKRKESPSRTTLLSLSLCNQRHLGGEGEIRTLEGV